MPLKEVEEGMAQEKLVFGPKPIIARDAQSAGIAAVLDSGEDVVGHDVKLNYYKIAPDWQNPSAGVITFSNSIPTFTYSADTLLTI